MSGSRRARLRRKRTFCRGRKPRRPTVRPRSFGTRRSGRSRPSGVPPTPCSAPCRRNTHPRGDHRPSSLPLSPPATIVKQHFSISALQHFSTSARAKKLARCGCLTRRDLGSALAVRGRTRGSIRDHELQLASRRTWQALAALHRDARLTDAETRELSRDGLAQPLFQPATCRWLCHDQDVHAFSLLDDLKLAYPPVARHDPEL